MVLCSFNLHFLPPLKTNVTSSKDLSRLKEGIIFMKFKWIFTPRWQREMSRPLVPAQTTMGGISRLSQLSHYSQIWSIRSRGQGGEAESKYIAVMPCQLPHWMSLLANVTGTLKQQKLLTVSRPKIEHLYCTDFQSVIAESSNFLSNLGRNKK